MAPPITVASPWRELFETFGGAEPFAGACGVSRSTAYRWARGDDPLVPVRRHVNAICRKHKLPEPWPNA